MTFQKRLPVALVVGNVEHFKNARLRDARGRRVLDGIHVVEMVLNVVVPPRASQPVFRTDGRQAESTVSMT